MFKPLGSLAVLMVILGSNLANKELGECSGMGRFT